MKLSLALAFSFFVGASALAEDKFSKEVAAYVGMSMISYAETEKTIVGDNVSEIASGTVSAISMNLQYVLSQDLKKQYYITATLPLLPSAIGTYMGGGFGMEYYFSDMASKLSMFNSGTSITLTPTFRYFAGFELGLGYLVYNTESATKTDILLEIGGTGGFSYALSEGYAIKMTVGVLKGTGVVTSAMNIRALLGVTFFLD